MSLSAAIAALAVLFVVALVPLAPTEQVLVASGVLAGTGALPLTAVIGVAAIGCALSDLINYAFGRSVGLRSLRRYRRKVGARSIVEWMAARLARRGEPILVAARFLPGGGMAGAILAGALNWPLRRFAPTAVVGATLWSTYAALLGYLGGKLLAQPMLALVASLAVAAALSLPAGLVIRRSQRRAAAAGDALTAGGLFPGVLVLSGADSDGVADRSGLRGPDGVTSGVGDKELAVGHA